MSSPSTQRLTVETSTFTRVDHNTAPVERYINRDISLLEFNRRVLGEAQDQRQPLLERLKFIAIVSSLIDEFFMVRVSGLKEQALEPAVSADGMPPNKLLN